MDQDMIPTLDAAELLGIDVGEVYRMIDQGQFTASWNGQRLVVPMAQVQALVGSSR